MVMEKLKFWKKEEPMVPPLEPRPMQGFSEEPSFGGPSFQPESFHPSPPGQSSPFGIPPSGSSREMDLIISKLSGLCWPAWSRGWLIWRKSPVKRKKI